MKKVFLALFMLSLLFGGGSGAKQEVTKSRNWLNVWKLDGAYIAVKKDGTLWKFGDISKRNFGILDKRQKRFLLTPKRVLPNKRVIDITVANNRVYAITSDGALWGWGREVIKNRYIKEPKRVGIKGDWKTVESVGTSDGGDCAPYTMGFDKSSNLYGWGDNYAGFVYYAPGSRPKYQVPKNLGKWSKVALGCYRIYGLRFDGSVWEWGIATKQLMPKKVSPNTYPTLYKKLKKQRAKIGKFYLKLGDKASSHQYNGISDGELWLLPI